VSAAPIVVALDGLGGDRAPREQIRGALAVAGPDLRVALVGDEGALWAELSRQGGAGHPHIEVVHAPDRIGSEEDGARAVKAKPNSSLVAACRMVPEGRAQAVVSGGHTGAMLAASILHLRRVPGVIRPGIAAVLPSYRGPVVLIDAGANADARPEYLPQFALMGRLLARDVLGISEPRVGLLSIGEEAGRGNELVQAAHAAMEGAPGFVGNVEGRDIPSGSVEVVVTDGFTGNVALKVYEGAGKQFVRGVRRELTRSVRGKLGATIARPALVAIRDYLDPEEYGGAYLLGVRGMSVIAHGNATGRGIGNAVRLAARGVREGVVAQLEAGLAAPRAPVG
jgi:glycerol-3-phosphate acyltransferase PlsX